MSIYSIHQCEISDIDRLVFFLDTQWKKNHSLVLSRELLDFQHYNTKDEKYNFLMAINNSSQNIDAIVGFIPTSQYDDKLTSNGDYWGAIWKIREDIKNEEINTVGFYIWKQLFKLPNFKSYAAIGISEIAKKIYKISRLELGSLNHYYIQNSQRNNFFIAKGLKYISTDSVDTSEDYKIEYVSINDVVEPLSTSYRPAKSLTYFKQRYANHPIYKYKFLGIYHNDDLISIWTVRLNSAENSSVLRIVDILGDIDQLPNLDYQIQKIIIDADVEYIDILNSGIDENIFSIIGFEKLDLHGEIIIPNYFEPFEQRNVKIDYAVKADFTYVIFKGDSDQDRPNIL